MANAYLNMAMSTTVEKAVRRAKSLARVPSVSNGVDYMASDPAVALNEMADCVNDAIREFISDFPILSVAETTLTTTAGVRRTALPETLRHADIMGMVWDYEGKYGFEITMITMADVNALVPVFTDDSCTQDPPDYCYLEWPQNGDTGNIVWLPVPAIARGIKLLYRAETLVVTSADVQAEGTAGEPVTLPVPDAMIEPFAYCLAYRMMERNQGQNGTDPAVMQAKYKKMVDEWTDRLASTPAQTVGARYGFIGLPRNSAMAPFHDLRSPNFNRR